MRDGQRDMKTKQRTDQSLQNLERTEEMRGGEDWQVGKTEIWPVGKEREGGQANQPKFKNTER